MPPNLSENSGDLKTTFYLATSLLAASFALSGCSSAEKDEKPNTTAEVQSEPIVEQHGDQQIVMQLLMDVEAAASRCLDVFAKGKRSDIKTSGRGEKYDDEWKFEREREDGSKEYCLIASMQGKKVSQQRKKDLQGADKQTERMFAYKHVASNGDESSVGASLDFLSGAKVGDSVVDVTNARILKGGNYWSKEYNIGGVSNVREMGKDGSLACCSRMATKTDLATNTTTPLDIDPRSTVDIIRRILEQVKLVMDHIPPPPPPAWACSKNPDGPGVLISQYGNLSVVDGCHKTCDAAKRAGVGMDDGQSKGKKKGSGHRGGKKRRK